MKRLTVTSGLVLLLTAGVQAQSTNAVFIPGSIAVLRVGTGSGPQGSTSPFDFASKQNAAFIDEYNVTGTNSAPVYTMPIPTNGNNALWFNGNAGTEGGMSRSADRSVLTWAGYSGTICSLSPGTAPSSLSYPRGICVVTAFTNSLVYSGQGWYGSVAGKTNPRGVVSDGTNEFYGCGSTYGTLQFDLPSGSIYQFESAVSSTRAVKIINNTLYTTINGSDGAGIQGYPAGIYNFVDDYNNPVPLPPPGETVFANLVVPTFGIYTNTEGFDINPQGNVAYVADNVWGIQKYVKSGGAWRFACNYSIASTNGNDTKDGLGGVLDMTVDYSGTNPVIYATTAESVGYKLGNFNFNRIVKIVDTNNGLTGLTFTNVTTLAQAWNTNVGFHSICFVPDLRPIITGNPSSQSAVVGTLASFTVSASESGAASQAGPIGYQWLENGTNLTGQTSATLTLNSPQLADSGSTFQCVVTNHYGFVTSAPPALLVVTAEPVAPQLATAQYLTNAIGDNVAISATVTNDATTPLSYQWYFNGTALAENGGANGEYSGTTNATLQISDAQLGVDDGDYYCVVTNIGGSVSNLVAALTLVYLPPVFAVQPGPTMALSNSYASFSVVAYGSSLSYQWYYNSSSNNIATFTPVSGANGSTFNVSPAVTGTNYFVVVTNQGGAITSSVVTLTVIAPPPSSYVGYTTPGQNYLQNFDSLPVATNTTYNTGNPVTITEWNGSAKGVTLTYSLADPFDFTYPVLASGSVGGLGLTNTMNGWYGAGSVQSKLGASQGDQSTGGIISFGTLSTNGVAETDRALGILSTSTTGNSSFGLKLINQTATSLTNISVSYLGEIWRNQPNVNTIEFGYYIDTNTNDTFVPTNALANLVPGLFVSFPPTSSLTTQDGSQPANQINLAVTNLNIGSWPANAALWLVWQQTNSAGSAQGMAIDNFSFSATNQTVSTGPILPLNITAGSMQITGSGASATARFSFTNATGLSFSILATNNIAAPTANWPVIGTAVENPAGSGNYQFTDLNPATNSTRFYILRQP
ncbi:MAG: hypothetical protein WBW41_17005 [Verrucomicrobiia bacterium]